MRIISVINQKGGCGKTTTAINLSACLSKRKRRVLLIDLDPQGHASIGLNLNPEILPHGMTEVLTHGAFLDDVICASVRHNLDVAPANITLSAIEQLLAGAAHKESRLLTAIEKLRRPYDYIIIDSPPNLGILTFNALRASALSIVPVDMGFFSLHGLGKLKETIEVIARHTGHRIELRALSTMVDSRMRFVQEVLKDLARHFEGKVFETRIRNNVRLREASSQGMPIVEYEANSNGAQDYEAVAQELIAMEEARGQKVSELQVPVGERVETALGGEPWS